MSRALPFQFRQPDAGVTLYGAGIRARLWLAQAVFSAALISGAVAGPFATEVVRARGPFGASSYGDTNAVLGAPARWFRDTFSAAGHRVKLVEAPYNVAPTNTGLLTTNLLLTLGAGSEVIVRFATPVSDDPAHPYGVDLLVFGNSFYTPNQFVSDTSDMGACFLGGNIFYEPMKVSVSPGFTGQPGEVANDPDTWPWYRYDHGPFADTAFPTHAFQWDRATTSWSDAAMDFTKPVNPALASVFAAGGMTAADGIELYDGAGGGTGFDLGESGFASIQYVKVEGLDPDFSDGEVDAFAAVRPMRVGDSLTVAPGNILSNTATLRFQRPGAEQENYVTLAFSAVSELARVETAPLTNLGGFAPVPGIVRAAVALAIAPAPGAAAPAFSADLTLAVDASYAGDGHDLLVFQAAGTNWNQRPFTYAANAHAGQLFGVTNLAAVVVAQVVAPQLQLLPASGHVELHFVPVANFSHTLERSTNLVHWAALVSFPAGHTLPVAFADFTAPPDRAFYRVRLELP